MFRFSRRRFLALGATATLAAVAGCRSGGFTFLGYQVGADALYDPNIRTVYVPLFNNRAFQTTPYRGFEVDVTEAVIREIGKTTPFRVTSDLDKADTELLGTIMLIQKTLLNRNQQNMIREGEIAVTVDVVWRDLRDGTILSNPRRPLPPGVPNPLLDAPPPPFDPNLPLPPDVREIELPLPQRIIATGRLIPELGETNATANTAIYKQIAEKIVSMMEQKWSLPPRP